MADPPELSEDVDLPPETRRYVLDSYARLATLTHYELLGVPRDADKKAIKRAYFYLAGLVHPDRYFGKKLGSYKAKLEALFGRLTSAHETLSVPEKRAQYDAALPAASPGEAPGPAAPVAPVDPAEEAKRSAARAAQDQQRAASASKAKQLADAGARARAAGDFVAAAEAYRSAMVYAPQEQAYAAAYADAKRGAGEKLRESFRRQAALEERWGHWAEAAASWRRVLEASPGDAEAEQRLAAAVAKTTPRG